MPIVTLASIPDAVSDTIVIDNSDTKTIESFAGTMNPMSTKMIKDSYHQRTRSASFYLAAWVHTWKTFL